MFDELTFALRYGPYIRLTFGGRSYHVPTPIVPATEAWLESCGVWKIFEPVIGPDYDVIFPVARTTAARLPGRRAGMLALEFPRYLSGSVLFGRKRAGAGDRNRQRDECPGVPHGRPV